MTTTLRSLVTMTEKDLNKMSKSDIVKIIKSSGYQLTHADSSIKDLEEKLKAQSLEELHAKKLLASYVGSELPVCEYTKEIQYKKVSLSELVGSTLCKAARY